MHALLFPNTDAVRLALASGVVPPEVARAQVWASAGHPRGLWVRSRPLMTKEALAALARIGVRPFASPPEMEFREFPDWSAALPLKRGVDRPPDAPALFVTPTPRLALFLRQLERGGMAAEGYCILGETALVRHPTPPLYWLDQCRVEPDSGLTGFRLVGPGFWVETGWEHPHPPAGNSADQRIVLVSAAKGWQTLEAGDWHAPREEHGVLAMRPAACRSAPLPPIEAVIRLKPRIGPSAPESLWVHGGTLSSLLPILESLDVGVSHQLEVAELRFSESDRRVVLRYAGERPVLPPLPAPLRAFAPHPILKRLLIPSHEEMVPALRATALAKAIGLQSAEIAWCESTAQGVRIHRFPTDAFRPLAEWIRYHAPEARPWCAAMAGDDPFAFVGFVAMPEASPVSQPAPPPSPPRRDGHRHGLASIAPSRSTFAKWAGKLFARTTEAPKEHEVVPDGAGDEEQTREVPRRIVRTQQERMARRAELEEMLFRRESASPPGGEARPWVELAELYADGGHPANAALCWLQALWITPHPPEHWLRDWAAVEARCASASSERVGSAEPTRALRQEIVEAICLAAGGASPPKPDFDRVGLQARMDRAEETLPCRMVWLARRALAALSGGDVLQLAQARDRLFARLGADTALAAQDTPSFLRFRGLSARDRYPLTREWLLRCREPIQRWLKQQSKSTRLTWAGLDADIPCTLAYADWMLAWGSAKLGDQARTNELARAAELGLGHATGPGVEPGVHRRLQNLFRSEIQAALGTAVDASERPVPVETRTDELGEYAVSKLVAHSQILSRHRSGSEFGGRPLAALLGDDELGRKLARLLDGGAPDMRAWLDLVNADRTARTLPRVILTLLEIPQAREHAAELLAHGPQALQLLPEALRIGNVHDSESHDYLVRVASRGVEVFCRLAVAFSLADGLEAVVRSLGQALDDDRPTRAIFRRTASVLFRALSRCGSTAELRRLLSRWYRVGGDGIESNLAAAIGWYTLGETERANRILNDARDRLFVRGIADERERTRTALAYVRSLAHAPPRFALGRLEELFQRLGPIVTGGATARYYALPPLELVDAAITALVNEDFGLGPELRNWLDADELQVRGRITRDLEAALDGARV